MPLSGSWAMQNATIRAVAPTDVPSEGAWLGRFFSKFVLDILPAALASVIGGFLFTQYHFDHAAPPQLVDVQPASPEMMAMVRDEHALIMSYLKAQTAAEQRRDQAEDAATARAVAEARAAADAKLAQALSDSQATVAQNAAATSVPAPAKAAPTHRKAPAVVAAAAHAPLTIAQADPPANDAASAAPGDAAAREPDTLFANPIVAKTLDIKDHVVAATRHVVSVIGEMFASLSDGLGGSVSGNHQFNSAS